MTVQTRNHLKEWFQLRMNGCMEEMFLWKQEILLPSYKTFLGNT